MTFCERLKQARINAGFSQNEAAEHITKAGYPIKSYVLSSWETGKHKPDIEQFVLLCDIYNADSNYLLTGAESRSKDSLLDGLNSSGRSHAVKYIDMLKADPIFTESERIVELKTFRLYDIPVSAGTGSYLDSDNYEEITSDDLIPSETDFAVRVSGDSMEPFYQNGQILFIKQQETLNEGEVGIFSLNGESYVKKLAKNTLVSLNTKYQPIALDESDDLRVFGKVIGAI